MVILSVVDLVAFPLPRVTGLLVNPAIHFFMTTGDDVSPMDVTIFGRWPLGSDEASFLLGDDVGFMAVDGGRLGSGSEMVWRLNGGGGSGSGDSGALRDGGFRDVGLGSGSKGV